MIYSLSWRLWGVPLWEGLGTVWRGWALAIQGQGDMGLAQLHQGLAAIVATGQEWSRPSGLFLLAEALGHTGQIAEVLRVLADALTAFAVSGFFQSGG